MAFLIGRQGPGGAGGGRGPEGPRFAALAEVRAYWEGLRSPTSLPRREDLDPRGIAGALEQTFLIERIAPGIGRFRLAGMQLSEILGMDPRGMPLSALMDPAGRTRLGGTLETVFDGPAVLDLWLEAERGIGRPALEARLLLLPLVSSRGLTDLALGCLATEGQIGRSPRRFAIAGVMSESLATVAQPHRGPLMPVHPQPQPQPHPQPQPGLAEAATPYQPPRPPRGRPQLRVVK